MDQVTISSDFTLEIPRQVREQAGFKQGQVLEVIALAGRMTLVLARTISEWRGFLKGENTFWREADRF